VGSLTFVSPGALTDGVTVFFLEKVMTFLAVIAIPLSPPSESTSDRLSTLLCKFSRKKFQTSIRYHPWMVSAPPPVTPLTALAITDTFLKKVSLSADIREVNAVRSP